MQRSRQVFLCSALLVFTGCSMHAEFHAGTGSSRAQPAQTAGSETPAPVAGPAQVAESGNHEGGRRHGARIGVTTPGEAVPATPVASGDNAVSSAPAPAVATSGTGQRTRHGEAIHPVSSPGATATDVATAAPAASAAAQAPTVSAAVQAPASAAVQAPAVAAAAPAPGLMLTASTASQSSASTGPTTARSSVPHGNVAHATGGPTRAPQGGASAHSASPERPTAVGQSGSASARNRAPVPAAAAADTGVGCAPFTRTARLGDVVRLRVRGVADTAIVRLGTRDLVVRSRTGQVWVAEIPADAGVGALSVVDGATTLACGSLALTTP